jgi:UrcA family protein
MNMNNHSKLFARYTGILVITGAFLSANAFAADPSDAPRSETVKFQDLNTGSNSGAAALYQRIHSAAQKVCAQPGDGRALAARSVEQRCMAQSEARAVESVHSSALTAFYQTKIGHADSVVVLSKAQ